MVQSGNNQFITSLNRTQVKLWKQHWMCFVETINWVETEVDVLIWESSIGLICCQSLALPWEHHQFIIEPMERQTTADNKSWNRAHNLFGVKSNSYTPNSIQFNSVQFNKALNLQSQKIGGLCGRLFVLQQQQDCPLSEASVYIPPYSKENVMKDKK